MNRVLESKICLQCGGEFFRHCGYEQWRTQKYCSKRCYGDNKMGQHINGITVYCDNCGENLYRTPSTILEHVFCSRKCMAEWRGRNLAGSNSPLFGKQRTIEERENMSREQLGNKNSVGPRPSISGEKNHQWGKPHTQNSLKKMSQRGKERWLDSEYVQKQIKSRGARPNKKELWLEAFIKNLSLPYRYVGDGEFILGGKCPDYLNTNGQKKLVELFGDYWHKDEDSQERIDYFAQYGFQTLIVWEYELESQDKLKEKLLSFDRFGV